MFDIYEITITTHDGEEYTGKQTAKALQQAFTECLR